MIGRLRLSLLGGLVLAVAGVALFAGIASAISGSQANVGNGKCWQNNSGNCYHWGRTSTGLSLKIENDLSTAWQSYYTRALAGWSFSADPPMTPAGDSVTLVMTAQNAYGTSNSCGGISGLVRACSRKYGFNGWLGLASIWIANDGEHIVAGTVKLNDSYFNTSTYNTVAWRNLVSCQELAHTLGLTHQDENFSNANLGSCMDYTSNPATNQYPNNDDRLTLANMYSHADGTSTVSAASAGSRGSPNGQGLGNDEDALPPGAAPRDGDIFVRKLPNGMTLITHVFWVEPGRP